MTDPLPLAVAAVPVSHGHMPREHIARRVLAATAPVIRRRAAHDIADGLTDGVCPLCTVGAHEACTDDGRSRACECARSTHGPAGIGVVR